MNMKIFNDLESNVRSYCRSFPVVFSRAKDEFLFDEEGKRYLDFLSGAGSLNYGHNNEILKKQLQQYLNEDGVVHGLDMSSTAKRAFLDVFQRKILFPREMDYKVQFSGPTGTNAVEAAFKLARKVTGRTNIISFTNGFHGVTVGSVSATGNSFYREGSGLPLNNTTFMPYDGYLGDDVNTIDYIRKFLEDGSSGVDLPAAMVVETVQGEGGVNLASWQWLRDLESLCREFNIILMVDDIQVGCGRTGRFFSFEEAGITPDIVVLSKSLSGYGLPFSVVLMRRELDQWAPGEHNGTFRGNNLAFVTATGMLNHYWSKDDLTFSIFEREKTIAEGFEGFVAAYPELELSARGRGMIWGLDCKIKELANSVSEQAFSRGLVIETCGSDGQVVKALPPLLIEESTIREGLGILEESFQVAVENMKKNQEALYEEILK